MATPASTVAIKQEPLDDWTDGVEHRASGTTAPSTYIKASTTTSSSSNSSSTTTTVLATGEPTKAKSAAGTAQQTGSTASQTVYRMTSSGPTLQETSPAPARVVANPAFKPLSFKLQISQGGGLRLASSDAASLSGTAGGGNTTKNSANSSGSGSSKPDDQTFFIRHNPKGTPQLCMSFKSDPSKLYVLQALAGQQLNLKINSPQQTNSVIPFVKVLANPKQGTVKDTKSSAQPPTQTAAGKGQSSGSTYIHNRPQPMMARQTAAPLSSRSLLKPSVRNLANQTVIRLADSTQRQSHSAGTPVHSLGPSSFTNSFKLSAGQSGLDSVKRSSKEPAILRTTKAKRKPAAVSLLLNAMKKCRSSDDTTAAAAMVMPADSSEATDSASEMEEEEESDFAFPFKIDSVFSLANDSPQQTNPWDEAGDSKTKVELSEGKPLKVEARSSVNPFYHSLTKEELLTLCGSSFVVIERLDQKDIEVLKRAGKNNGQEASSHERSRCSDYCRKRTLNYLCMLNLIRCSEPKRRCMKIEPNDLKQEPDADPEWSNSFEKSGLHSAIDRKNSAFPNSNLSGTSDTKEAVTSGVKVTTVVTKEARSPSLPSTSALKAESNSALGCDRTQTLFKGGTSAGISFTSQLPFISALSGEESVLLCSQPAEADTAKKVTTGTVQSGTGAEKTGGASDFVQETSESSQVSSDTSQKASETSPQNSLSNLHEAPGTLQETSPEASSIAHDPSNVAPEVSGSESSMSMCGPNPVPVVPSTSGVQISELLPPQVRDMSGTADTDRSPYEEKTTASFSRENPASIAASVETSKLGSANAKLAPASELLQNVVGAPETPSMGPETPDGVLTETECVPGSTAVAGASSVTTLVAAPPDRTSDQPSVASSVVEKTTSLPGSHAPFPRANTAATIQPKDMSCVEAKTSATAFVFPAVQTSPAPTTATTTSSSILLSLINSAIATAPSAVPAAGVERPTPAAAIAGIERQGDVVRVFPNAAQASTTAVQTNAGPPYALLLPSLQSSGGPVVLVLPCSTGLNVPSVPLSGCTVTTPFQQPQIQSPAPLPVTSDATVKNLPPFSPIPALPALIGKSKVRPPSTDPLINHVPATCLCNPAPSQAGKAKDSSASVEQSSPSLAPPSPVLFILNGSATDAAKAGVACPASSDLPPPATPLTCPPGTAASVSTVPVVSPSTMSQPTPPVADSKFVTLVMGSDGKLMTIPEASQIPGKTNGDPMKTLPCLGSRGNDATSPLTTVFIMSGSSPGHKQAASPAETQAKMKVTPSVSTAGLQKRPPLVSLIRTPVPHFATTKSKKVPAGPQAVGELRSVLLGSTRFKEPTAFTTTTAVNTLTASTTTARTTTSIMGTTTFARTATPTPTTTTKTRTSSSSTSSSHPTTSPPAGVVQAIRSPDGSLTLLNAPPGAGHPSKPFKVILKPTMPPLGGAVGSSSAKTAGEVSGAGVSRSAVARKDSGVHNDEEKLRKQLNMAIVMPPKSLTRTTHSPSTPSSSSMSLESSFHSGGPSKTPPFPSPVDPSSSFTDLSRPLSSSSLLLPSDVQPVVQPSANTAKKSSTAGSDSESRGRRARLESRYPLPPGVVIKTEPETFGYPTGPEETANTDNWFSGSHHSVGDAVSSTQQSLLGLRTAEQTVSLTAAQTYAGERRIRCEFSANSEAFHTPAVSPPAGTCRLGEEEQQQTESTTGVRRDRGESADPVGSVSSDLDYTDFDMPGTGGDADVDDDEPPVLSPVAPLSPSCRDEDEQQQNEDELVQESSPGSDGCTQERASLHFSDDTSHTARSHGGSSVKRRSRVGPVTSQRLAETELHDESSDILKPKSKANTKTRPSSSSERQIFQTGSKHRESGEGEREVRSSASSLSTMAPPALVPEYPFTSTPVVSSSASSMLSEITGSGSTSSSSSSSSSSNDRIRRLKEMLKQQNEQLEQIRRERAMQLPLFPMDD